MTSKNTDSYPFLKAQRRILKQITEKYPEVYLVGGTAISLLYRHRVSEDLDFFTQHYTGKLHKEIAAYVRCKTGYSFSLVDEETRRNFVNMAVYEFEIGKGMILKVDFVSDFVPLLKQPGNDGIASIDDVYYRKILAVTGWEASRSSDGRTLAGGRQKTKDLFDIFYLSKRTEPLSEWFPKHFGQGAYERLAAWYLAMPKQRAIGELLELIPGCDTKAIFAELDRQIIYQLNRVYIGL